MASKIFGLTAIATRHASDVSTAVGIGWRVAAWAALARACASGAGAAWPFSTSAIELKDNKRPRAPPRNQRTPAVSEQVMVPVTSSCQLSVAVDAQSTDLCRAGATSRYGERCAQLPWCAHPSSDVWRPLAQPLSTISTQDSAFGCKAIKRAEQRAADARCLHRKRTHCRCRVPISGPPPS